MFTYKNVNSDHIKLLFTIKDNMTNDLLNTIQKLFKLHAVDGIHPSKRTILKFYSVLYHEIVIHC